MAGISARIYARLFTDLVAISRTHMPHYSMPDGLNSNDILLDKLDNEDLVKIIKSLMSNGVAISFHGKRTALEIARKVRPRVMRRESKFHVGSPEEQSRNILIEGENLQAMVTLYKYRGQVDLIVTDPPYNTGKSFRYNDKWDDDPNDPELGTIVTREDGSRHTKWIKFMMPRLQMMKAMLKEGGVIAICIDENELFHLGMLMDEVFGEDNRLGIINWQKTTPKNDAKHVSSITEYVLVYAKDIELARTASLDRTKKSEERFFNPDNDVLGDWKQDNLTAASGNKNSAYAIQSPFTGVFHLPGNRFWANKKSTMKEWLEGWGVHYDEISLGSGKGKALAVHGWRPSNSEHKNNTMIQEANARATDVLTKGNWPILYWGLDGNQKPVKKTHKLTVKAGAVPVTFWVEEDELPIKVDAVSWLASMSGRSRDGIEELSAIVGKGHGFETVKPLKLIKKIIQLWCPPNGLVLDPFAGSGTIGHAVLELNCENQHARRFILIEQGSPDNGDKYARTLTWMRLHNAITGERPLETKSKTNAKPLGGGFEFRVMTGQIDAKTVLSMKKDELVDVVITSHWEADRRNSCNIMRIDDPKMKYLVGKNDLGEGYFIIWNNGGPVGRLDIDSYKSVLGDAKRAGLEPPYHVYARYEIYQSPNVKFWKIPDKILSHLGLNENIDSYNDNQEMI